MMKRKVENLEKKIGTANLSQAGLIWYRFKKNKLAVFGLVALIVIIVICFTSPLYISYKEDVIQQNLIEAYQEPSLDHFFGTDMFGRDLFSRIMYGGIISLSCGLAVVVMALGLGIFFGGIAGYYGGKIDFVIMRVMDIFMSIPFLLMTMTLIVAFGKSTFSMLAALSITMFPGMARLVRSSILTIIENEYIDACKCYGCPAWKILIKHILPNGIGPVVITATLMLGSTILAIAGLGFLGIGISAPTPEWGTILSEARSDIRYYPYLGIIPGVAIGISVLCINFIGDGFRDALDPRTKK